MQGYNVVKTYRSTQRRSFEEFRDLKVRKGKLHKAQRNQRQEWS
jgi:hypothetical protein